VIGCRWLSELKNTSKESFEASYEAYEKAKKQLSFRRRSKSTTKAVEKEPARETITTIQLDIETFRASHALRLAELFASTDGQDKVQLALMKGESQEALLQLPLTGFSKSIQKDVEGFPCWISTGCTEVTS